MSAVDDVRVEVAFSADPNTTTPAFVDLTSRARLDAGIGISRGRQDETSAAQAGQCTLTFDNTDGALSPGLASSPYYPNVRPQNRVRVTYRATSSATNLLCDPGAGFTDTVSATFNALTVGAWAPGGSVPPTLTNSTVRSVSDSRSMLITWGTGGSFPLAGVTFQTVIGRTYIASAYVWVPAGSPAVELVIAGTGSFGTPSSTTGAWERISVSWTAATGTTTLQIWPMTAPTAGMQCWVDSAMVDEGSTLRPFTTSSTIAYRFDGYVDEWPLDWPTGGQTEAVSTVTAVDLQGRIGRKDALDSVIAETYKLNTPTWYFPLGEASESTSAGDRMGTGSTLTVQSVGAGTGTLVFADGTGPGTDGGGAPAFAPTSVTNGLYLAGAVTPPAFSLALTLEATFLTSTLAAQTVARWSDPYGTYLEIGTDATGKAQAIYVNPWNPAENQTITSASVFANGRTHVAAITFADTGGGAMSMSLLVDSAVQGAPATWTAGGFVPKMAQLSVGGNALGKLFTGTISHVAGFNSALTLAQHTQHHLSASTGFAGERSDQRIARIASWIGLPAGLQSLDVGAATIAHVDATGRSAWDYMQDVATTEAGIVFISTTGALTFYNRGRSYATGTAATVTVTADLIGPDTRIVYNLADIVNDVTVERAGGATARVTSPTSISTYGVLSDSLTVISNTDADAFDRANWILGLLSMPFSRLPELTLDALTDASTSPQVRLVDIYSRVAVTGMPSQAPASTADLRVQGYREDIGRAGWLVTANTTPFLPAKPLTADDATYGVVDSDNRAVY